MAQRREPRAALAVELLELAVAVVESAGEMGRRTAGLTAADRTVVHDDDALTAAGETVRAPPSRSREALSEDRFGARPSTTRATALHPGIASAVPGDVAVLETGEEGAQRRR